MLRHFINLLLWHLPPSRLFALRRLFLKCASVDIKKNVNYCGRGWIYGRGIVTIGAGTWLSPGVIIHSHAKASVTIGERCDIGPGVEFIPGSHLMGDYNRRAGTGTALDIKVGAGSWIGAGSRILGGVLIGEGSIVAAGSVVTKNVPANTLVAGVPARAKRRLE